MHVYEIMDSSRYRFVKVVVLGIPCTGKSCLIRAYTSGKYVDVRQATTFTDVSFKMEDATIRDHHEIYVTRVKVEIWDTQGDLSADRLSFLIQGTSAVLLAFDLSYSKLLKCKEDHEKFVSFLDMYRKVCVTMPFVLLVGTKSDKVWDVDLSDFEYDEDIAKAHLNYVFKDVEDDSRSEEEEVTESIYVALLNVVLYKIKSTLVAYNVPLNFIATSSKDMENVDDCFRIAMRRVIEAKIDIEKDAKSIYATHHDINAAKKFNYLETPSIKLSNPITSKSSVNGGEASTCCN